MKSLVAFACPTTARMSPEPLDETDDFLALPAEIEPHVHRDLIVAAAGGVQLLARLADAGGELRLHEHVDVLRLGVDLEISGLDVGKDAFPSAISPNSA